MAAWLWKVGRKLDLLAGYQPIALDRQFILQGTRNVVQFARQALAGQEASKRCGRAFALRGKVGILIDRGYAFVGHHQADFAANALGGGDAESVPGCHSRLFNSSVRLKLWLIVTDHERDMKLRGCFFKADTMGTVRFERHFLIAIGVVAELAAGWAALPTILLHGFPVQRIFFRMLLAQKRVIEDSEVQIQQTTSFL